MNAISFAIFLSILLVASGSEVVRQSRSLKFDGLLVMRANYAIIYGLCPLCLFFFTSLYSDRIDLFGLVPGEGILFQIAIACLGAYIMSSIGYRLGGSFKPIGEIRYDAKQLKRAVIFGGLFVFVALNIYTYQYGGFVRAVELSGFIRQGFQDDVLETSGELLFIQNLTPVAFVLTPAAFALMAKEKTFVSRMIFLGSFILSGMIWLILGSRGHIVISLALLFFGYMNFKYNGEKSISPGTLILMLLGAFILDYFLGIGKSLSAAMYRDDLTFSDVFDQFKYAPLGSLVGYYDDYISSAIVSMSIKNPSYTYFYDSLISPAYLVPSRLFDFTKPESVMYYNTYLVIGAWESVVTPGLIAYGNYSLGPIGIAISAIIYGFVLGILDKANIVSAPMKYANTLLITPLILYWGIYYFQGDPKTLIGTLVSPVMFVLLMLGARTRNTRTER